MLKYSLVITYGIICIAAAVIKISKHNGKDKSVNLALETVFEFDNDEKKTDVNILNKVQRFLGKVKNVIENGNTGRRQLIDENKKIFSSFITNVIKILNDYDNRALKKFTSIISQEMKNHHYTGCKFYELADNIEQERVFANKLAEMKNKPADEIRDDLKAIANKINEGKYAKSEKELLDIINSVYQEDSIGKFQDFLRGIDGYRQKLKDDINITKVISEGLKTILFDHYTNLTISLRASLLSKLQDYIKYYNENLFQKPATKNKQALRNLRQVNEKMKQHDTDDDNDYKDRTAKSKLKVKKQTSKSQHHLNVPTTRKSKSEYSKELLRSPKSERYENKNRYVNVERVREENPSNPVKKRNIGTTKERRTLRQMYVEKNLDLKYDPDAYEHLTTTKNIKTKKLSIPPFNSPTTRKHSYKSNKPKKSLNYNTENKEYGKKPKAEDNSYESNYNNKDKSDETVMTDFIIDFSSETFKSTTKYRLTKMARHFGQTFIDKDLDYNYDMKPEFRSKRKKLTFKTLYPTFVIEWSTPPNGKRQFGVTEDVKVRLPKHGGNEGSQLFTYEPGSHGGIKLVKNLDYSIEVKKPRNWELGVHHKRNLKNSRHQNEHHHKDNPKITGGRLQKTVRHHPADVPVLRRQDRKSVDGKLKMSRDPMILARQYEVPHHFSRKLFRRQFMQPPVISEEGLSIEGLKDDMYKISYRRNNNPNTTDNIDGNKHVLRRIINLENELELVKIQIKNDTNLINVLNKNISNTKKMSDMVNSDKRKATPIYKITKTLNSKTDFNMDDVTEIKSINADGQSKDILEIKERNNYVINKQSTDTHKQFIERKYDDYQYKNQSKTTKVLKEAYTFAHVTKNQGRKAFPDLKEKQEIQSDKNEINKKSYDSKNNKIKKRIEHSSIENNMQYSLKDINKKDGEIVSDKGITEIPLYFRNNEEMDNKSLNVTVNETIKNKYSFTIGQLKNDTLRNQSDTKLDNSWLEVVYKERQFKNKNDDNQPKENAIKDYTKSHAANIETQSNNSKELKRDGQDYGGVVFRAVDMTTGLSDTLGANTITRDDLFKADEETTEDIIAAIEKTVLAPQTPTVNVTASSDTYFKRIKKDNIGLIDQLSNGKTVQNGGEDKNKEVLHTTPQLITMNDTLPQTIINKNIQTASNVTAYVENKV